MKKNLLGFLALILISVVACKKDAFTEAETAQTEQLTSDFDSPIVEDYDNLDFLSETESEPFELQERASLPLPKLDSVYSASGKYSADGCAENTLSKSFAIAANETVTIKGQNLGASQGTGTLTAAAKYGTDSVAIPLTVVSWTATQITATVGTIPDTLKASIKFSAKIPYKKADTSTVIVLKAKTKTLKALANRAYGLFGSSAYEINKQRALAGNTAAFSAASTAIDSATNNYVPVRGDILARSDSKNAVVVAVGAADDKGVRAITIWQRNGASPCTTSIKKGTWQFKRKFVAKSTEATSGTWTKFSH